MQIAELKKKEAPKTEPPGSRGGHSRSGEERKIKLAPKKAKGGAPIGGGGGGSESTGKVTEENRTEEIELDRRQPLIIEVNEMNEGMAISKINNFAADRDLKHALLAAFVVGINSRDETKEDIAKLDSHVESAKKIAKALQDNDLLGGAIPFTWNKTTNSGCTPPLVRTGIL